MPIEDLLAQNTKGVTDLLHHEVSELALAYTLSSLPQTEAVLQEIETLLYKRVVNIVQDIFEQILASLELEESLTYNMGDMRQNIQLFVNEKVKDTMTNLHTKIKWWEKKNGI